MSFENVGTNSHPCQESFESWHGWIVNPGDKVITVTQAARSMRIDCGVYIGLTEQEHSSGAFVNHTYLVKRPNGKISKVRTRNFLKPDTKIEDLFGKDL